MITTFTQALDFTEKLPATFASDNQVPDFDAPSAKIISNILNFSKNLEVKKSKLIQEIEFIKS